MIGNSDKQLRLIVVLNFILTLWMISQQHQVTYQNMESFGTKSTLTLLGTLPDVLQCSPICIHQELMLLIKPGTLAG